MTTKYYIGTTLVPMTTALPRVANNFTGVTEKVTVVDADEILVEDSAASGVKKRVPSSNFLYGGGVFCTQQEFEYIDPTQTTTSQSWQTYNMGSPFTLTGPGKFMVSFRALLYSTPETNDGIGFKIINYTTSTDIMVAENPGSSGLWVSPSENHVTNGFFTCTLADGVTNEYRMQFRAQSANTVGLGQGRLFGFRIE